MTQQLGLARTTAVLEISNSTAMRINSWCHFPGRYHAGIMQEGIMQHNHTLFRGASNSGGS